MLGEIWKTLNHTIVKITPFHSLSKYKKKSTIGREINQNYYWSQLIRTLNNFYYSYANSKNITESKKKNVNGSSLLKQALEKENFYLIVKMKLGRIAKELDNSTQISSSQK